MSSMREAKRHSSLEKIEKPPHLSLNDYEFPPLPVIVRYYSDYHRKTLVVRDLETNDVWELGATEHDSSCINFSQFPMPTKQLLKCWTVWAMRRLSIGTINQYIWHLSKSADKLDDIFLKLLSGPIGASEYWHSELLAQRFPTQFRGALKSVLHSFADYVMGGWSADNHNQIQALPIGSADYKSVGVIEGVSILSSNEQAAIVSHFDNISSQVEIDPTSIADSDLRNSCILYWMYAHGVRPIQIANRDMEDLRIWNEGEELQSVHLTFRYAKQRSSGKSAVQTRTMKRDWAQLMVEFVNRRKKQPKQFVTEKSRPYSLFGLSPRSVSSAVGKVLFEVTGVKRRPYDLRHTAAQRNVDAGMSALELAEFLMHVSIDTGQVYYDTSKTQAEKINAALGLSPIYGELAGRLRREVIGPEELKNAANDAQIGAIPHGFPILGIGRCELGQSLCSKNPALSCYSCSKFLALNDLSLHMQVRDTFQKIVKQFVRAGGSEIGQPAFVQLREALEGVGEVIDQITAEANNE